MMKVKGGFRLTEDAHKTPMNPNPRPDQLKPNESLEQLRRLHQNDVATVPLFLTSGLLCVRVAPVFVIATTLFGAYVVTCLINFAVVMSEGTTRAPRRGLFFFKQKTAYEI